MGRREAAWVFLVVAPDQGSMDGADRQSRRREMAGGTIMRVLLLTLTLLPGCEFTFRFTPPNHQPKAKPVARQNTRPIPNPTGHDTIDRMGGWEAIEEKRRSIPRKEYDAWLEEHRRSQDGPFLGNGG